MNRRNFMRRVFGCSIVGFIPFIKKPMVINAMHFNVKYCHMTLEDKVRHNHNNVVKIPKSYYTVYFSTIEDYKVVASKLLIDEVYDFDIIKGGKMYELRNLIIMGKNEWGWGDNPKVPRKPFIEVKGYYYA